MAQTIPKFLNTKLEALFSMHIHSLLLYETSFVLSSVTIA